MLSEPLEDTPHHDVAYDFEESTREWERWKLYELRVMNGMVRLVREISQQRIRMPVLKTDHHDHQASWNCLRLCHIVSSDQR